MKKVLFVATVAKKHIMEFHIPYLKLFKEHEWETAVAARNDFENRDECVIPYSDTYYDVPFERSPFKASNIAAYKELKKIICEGSYDIIHCHTPVGALLTRFAARSVRKRGTHVVYTAHGFHFFKGAPLLNWIVYFPVEWVCSFLTDILITINQEDYLFAKKHMHAKQIEYVPGVGIDLHKFESAHTDAGTLRKLFHIPEDGLWVLNVGELIQRKNQESLIRAIKDVPNVYLTIAGSGDLYGRLSTIVESLELGKRVKLLGYRNDIPELCQAADVFALPSLQEGLPVAIMEAMACKKPIICSSIRGNTDLVDDKGGVLFDPHNVDDIRSALEEIMGRDKVAMGQYNAEKIKKYELPVVINRMEKLYGL